MTAPERTQARPLTTAERRRILRHRHRVWLSRSVVAEPTTIEDLISELGVPS